MAELLENIPPFLIICEFLWCSDDEVVMENEIQDGVVHEKENFANSWLFWSDCSRVLYKLDVFRSHFRMSRTTFELLTQMIVPSEHIPKGNSFGRPVVKPDKQIAIAVWMMANQETHRQISDRFDVSLSSVSRCFRRVCRALVDLLPDLVKWPNGR